MIPRSARSASTNSRAVLTIALSVAMAVIAGRAPLQAGFTFSQLEADKNMRIANENTRHLSVMTELEYERQMATKKLADQLKICTTANCKAAQRTDEARTQSQLDVEEDHENAVHAKKIAQINADIAAEEKANAAAPKPKP